MTVAGVDLPCIARCKRVLTFMKCAPVFFYLLLTCSVCWAHVQAPFYDHARGATAVYLAKVVGVEGHRITFSITQVLRGDQVSKLTLTTYEPNFTLNTEWLLAHGSDHGYGQDSLGWALKGDCAWVEAEVVHKNGEIYFVDWVLPSEGLTPDITFSDGNKGFTIGHLQTALQK